MDIFLPRMSRKEQLHCNMNPAVYFVVWFTNVLYAYMYILDFNALHDCMQGYT